MERTVDGVHLHQVSQVLTPACCSWMLNLFVTRGEQGGFLMTIFNDNIYKIIVLATQRGCQDMTKQPNDIPQTELDSHVNMASIGTHCHDLATTGKKVVN